MSQSVSFAKDIRPLFTDVDIDHMKDYFDLSNYDDVKTNAQNILGRLRAKGPRVMPPPPPRGNGPWSPEKISLFAAWIDGGFQR